MCVKVKLDLSCCPTSCSFLQMFYILTLTLVSVALNKNCFVSSAVSMLIKSAIVVTLFFLQNMPVNTNKLYMKAILRDIFDVSYFDRANGFYRS